MKPGSSTHFSYGNNKLHINYFILDNAEMYSGTILFTPQHILYTSGLDTSHSYLSCFIHNYKTSAHYQHRLYMRQNILVCWVSLTFALCKYVNQIFHINCNCVSDRVRYPLARGAREQRERETCLMQNYLSFLKGGIFQITILGDCWAVIKHRQCKSSSTN